jgi:Novel STAND NTPase 1/WD domain, G-beta repeat
MSEPGEGAPAGLPSAGNAGDARIRQEAQASGNASIIQSGRDTHYYLGDGVRHQRRTDGPVVEECPYPGLAAFTPGQAQWFFGRDRLIAEVTSRLDQRRDGGGPLIVVAPSGAGKSSLLQAGVIPALARGALPGAGSRDWPRLVFTPTFDPIAQVAAHIAPLAGGDPDRIGAELAADPGRAAVILGAARRAPGPGGDGDGARVIVVVDQLEELFTLCTEAQRRAFIDLLARLAEPAAGRPPAALVICGLRADFYAPCTQYPRLRTALQDGQILLGPMSQDQLRETILYPAQLVGLDIEPGLVELLLRDIGATGEAAAGGDGVGYEAGRLPLLAHALRATWQQRHGSTLTVDAYRATGGIQHAVATTAEQVYNRLGGPAQQATRWMFLRLVKVGEGPIEDTRRRATRADLLAEAAAPEAAATVLDDFTRARLLTQEQDTVEITHEALLRAWPRLRQWIDSDRAGNLLHQELEDDAANWERQGRDSSALYRGGRLAAARGWAAAAPHGRDLSAAAAAFLAESGRQQRRSSQIRRAAVAALAAATLVATSAAIFGFKERSSAQASSAAAIEQRNRAISADVGTEANALYSTNSALAKQLSVAAYNLADTPEARGSLLNAASQPLAGELSSAGDAAFNFSVLNSTGSILATSAPDAVQFWRINPADPTQPANITTVHATRRVNVVPWLWFDPASSTTLAILYGGRVSLDTIGKTVTGVALRPVSAAAPSFAAFGHDGRMLAVGYNDGTVQLWNIANTAKPLPVGHPFIAPGGGNNFRGAAFSPDDATLATLTGNSALQAGAVRLWDISDPAAPRLLPATAITSVYNVLAFGPVGHILVTASADDSLQLWNLANPGRPRAMGRPLPGHSGFIDAVAFSPDGRMLASASWDNSIRLWNLSDPAHPAITAIMGRQPATELFTSVSIAPGGLLAAAAIDIRSQPLGMHVWLWPTDPRKAAASVCAATLITPPITRTQWQSYFPGLPYNPPCPTPR